MQVKFLHFHLQGITKRWQSFSIRSSNTFSPYRKSLKEIIYILFPSRTQSLSLRRKGSLETLVIILWQVPPNLQIFFQVFYNLIWKVLFLTSNHWLKDTIQKICKVSRFREGSKYLEASWKQVSSQ